MKKFYSYLTTVTLLFLILLVISCSFNTNDDYLLGDPKSSNQKYTTSEISGKLSYTTTFGGSLNDSAEKVIATNDGGYAIIGFTQSNDQDITSKTDDSYDIVVLKYSEKHTLEWSKTFGSTKNDRGNDILQTKDGGYIILGFASLNDKDINTSFGLKDVWLAKLDPAGNLLWQKSYGFGGDDFGESILETEDGGFFFCGELDVSGSEGKGDTTDTIPDFNTRRKQHAGGDYWAVKINKKGDLEWSRYFGGFFTDTPYKTIATNDGGYVLVGSSDSVAVDINNNKGSYDFWILKISGSGELLWRRNFGGNEIDRAYSIVQTNDNNFLLVGESESIDQDVNKSNGASDFWLVKMNPEGGIIWEKTIGGSDYDVCNSIVKTFDNNFLISGFSRSNDNGIVNKGENDVLIIKINDKGEVIWRKNVGGSLSEKSTSAAQLKNGNLIIVGDSNSSDIDIKENKGFTDLLIMEIK